MMLVIVYDSNRRVVSYMVILKIAEKKRGKNAYLDGFGMMGLFLYRRNTERREFALRMEETRQSLWNLDTE